MIPIAELSLNEMWRNLRGLFSPYTLEDFIRDSEPQSIHEVEALEREYYKVHSNFKTYN